MDLSCCVCMASSDGCLGVEGVVGDVETKDIFYW